MKVHRLSFYFSILLLAMLLLPICKVNSQNYVGYKIIINTDNSATWIITKFSDLNAPIDTWETFQTRIYGLVDSASSLTKRDMTVNESSLQINTTFSANSKTTEYMFTWQNFSTTQNSQLTFGDVFKVKDFFNQLYGDAEMQISYPEDCFVKSVLPVPNSGDISENPLKWYSAQTFAESNPSVVLKAQGNATDDNNNGIWQQYGIVLIAVAIVATSLAGFYVYKQRKPSIAVAKPSPNVMFEGGDDKIISLLKASGGTMRQSAIVDQSGFSKAKTSQLLAVMERRGNVTRYKKGRDKIVVLKEPGKGEKSWTR
jgi:uncharacterized membrane protein